ncbi:MAG: UDP-2,3-diacylglucosamine diphosphatase [Saprospiraceae bacterium]
MHLRYPEVVIISDIHLGTFGCHAKELIQYLDSIRPNILILNGDIMDMWNFRKSYFPITHTEVIRKIFKMAGKGVKVYYIPGNHDEILRKYLSFKLGNIKIVEKLIMTLDEKKYWIFHGDVFDATTKGSAKLIAKLGGKGYDLLILFNSFINAALKLIGKKKMSFSKKIKNSVKRAIAWIDNFENTAISLAIEEKFDYVICGHIHQPQIRTESKKGRSTTYMNSGDWIENLTALEYKDKEWAIYHYNKKDYIKVHPKTADPKENIIPNLVLKNKSRRKVSELMKLFPKEP